MKLLPPPPGPRGTFDKTVANFIQFVKEDQSIEDINTKSLQPVIVAQGTSKASIKQFYIIIDNIISKCLF